MAGVLMTRWKTVAAKLNEAKAQGRMGIVAAGLKMPEYKLHDLTKLEDSRILPVTAYELRKLYKYFESGTVTRPCSGLET